MRFEQTLEMLLLRKHCPENIKTSHRLRGGACKVELKTLTPLYSGHTNNPQLSIKPSEKKRNKGVRQFKKMPR